MLKEQFPFATLLLKSLVTMSSQPEASKSCFGCVGIAGSIGWLAVIQNILGYLMKEKSRKFDLLRSSFTSLKNGKQASFFTLLPQENHRSPYGPHAQQFQTEKSVVLSGANKPCLKISKTYKRETNIEHATALKLLVTDYLLKGW